MTATLTNTSRKVECRWSVGPDLNEKRPCGSCYLNGELYVLALDGYDSFGREVWVLDSSERDAADPKFVKVRKAGGNREFVGCTCKDHLYRNRLCKHGLAVVELMAEAEAEWEASF